MASIPSSSAHDLELRVEKCSIGTVKRWDDDEGCGVLVSPGVPGEVFTHFSCIDGQGYMSLNDGEHVHSRASLSRPQQDGYSFRATRVARLISSTTPIAGKRPRAMPRVLWDPPSAFASSPSWIATERSVSARQSRATGLRRAAMTEVAERRRAPSDGRQQGPCSPRSGSLVLYSEMFVLARKPDSRACSERRRSSQ